MMNIHSNDMINQMIDHWKYISPVVHEPQNQLDYDQLSLLLDTLLDRIGEDESHQLIGLVDIISHMISTYDEHEDYIECASGVDALKFLIHQHQLKQTDLSDIASQGVLSEILNRKRKLNLSQIKKLATRFNVSVETFID